MADYNPHDTLTLEFREAEREIGTRMASLLFDSIRRQRSLKRLQELADQMAQQERSAAVDALLESLSEFMAVHEHGERLSASVPAALDEDDECVACALCAGGVCPDHGAAGAR